jgi:hypothetical protein
VYDKLTLVGPFIADLRAGAELLEVEHVPGTPVSDYVTTQVMHERHKRWADKHSNDKPLSLVDLNKGLRELGWEMTTHAPQRWRGKILRAVDWAVLTERSRV